MQTQYRIIGMMSGTSLDGMDLVYAVFQFKGTWHFTIEAAQSFSYSKPWQNILRSIHKISEAERNKHENDYVQLIAKTVRQFCETHGIHHVDALCSHGHTVFHEPEKGITYQMGNRFELAQLLGFTVVCDFRTQDVAMGGQGAPLVPIGDAKLFHQYNACLNLGGFANVSFTENQQTIAFDIGAVNTVLNGLALKIGQPFDQDGELARKGKRIAALWNRLEEIEYYQRPYPKSLGIEWVAEILAPILFDFEHHPVEDVMATYTEHISNEIGKQLNPTHKVLVSGGGAKNTYLIEQIQKHTKATLFIPDEKIIDFKEALIFGFLGVLRLRGEVNCLASVTGAHYDHSSGNIFYPQKLK